MLDKAHFNAIWNGPFCGLLFQNYQLLQSKVKVAVNCCSLHKHFPGLDYKSHLDFCFSYNSTLPCRNADFEISLTYANKIWEISTWGQTIVYCFDIKVQPLDEWECHICFCLQMIYNSEFSWKQKAVAFKRFIFNPMLLPVKPKHVWITFKCIYLV